MTRPGPAARLELDDRRQFLVRSLEDAAREHDAGDLSDEDYRLLERRDRQRLDEVDRLLAAEPGPGGTEDGPGPDRVGGPGGNAPTTRWPTRSTKVAGLIGATLVVAGATLLVVRLTTSRLPGQTLTGTVQMSQAQRITEDLGQADALLARNDVSGAYKLYAQVLALDPHDPPALAQLGWLTYEEGVETSNDRDADAGRSLVQEAIDSDRRFGPAHLYDGVILLQTGHDPAAAVAQFRLFLREDPSKQNLRNGAPFIRQAFDDAHLPVPGAIGPGPAAAS